ncbi:ankyrin repeat-containing protein At5g02620-like isoform X1 [Miscanthus floridulus]|uniref:ankyrin repeat-containing protein At5g02620-like isoform X1 n=1 Tax=Miscanthus floridulus TaxID=154761 RepID=UPI003459352D
MERQSSIRLGALEKLKSFRGMEKQKSFRGIMSLERRSRDSPGKRGDTPLHLAARSGSVAHAQRILAELDRALVAEMAARQNQDGETPLYVAAEKGHAEVVREILKVSDVQTAGIKASNSFDAFHIAAKQGHLGHSELQICNRPSAFKANNSLLPFLGYFAEVLKEMLQALPALAMTTNSVNATALDTAAILGHVDIVNLLLETDASLARIARNNGKTVLHSAARMGHVEVVRSLLNKDPGIGLRTDKKGQTALHMASKGHNAEIVVELLKPDVSVIRIEDNKGNRPLHVATRKGNIIIVQTLLSVEGIDVNAVNRSGETAFAIAEKMNNEELVNILKEAGGETAKQQVHPPNSAKQLKQTVSDIRHDVQSQIKQTRQTKMQVNQIKKRLEKLHIGGLNNAINSNTVVAVLIATVAFAAIFTVPGNFVEDLTQAPPGMSLGQAYVASNPAFIIFLVFDALALFISLSVVVVQTSLIVVERRAKKRMVFVMNKLMWLACLFISVAFIALTYVVVGRDDWWLAWCTMVIGTVIMLTTLGSMCYCIITHRLEEKNTRKIRKKASASQSRGSWSRSVDSDEEILNSEYKTKMYAL